MKICEFCSKPFAKRPNEYPNEFGRRKTCSATCSRRLIATKNRASVIKKVERRTCPMCSASFIQKRSNQEMCSRRCARRKAVTCMSAKRASGDGWLIVDTETDRPYIDRLYESESVAKQERAELLAGYPSGHDWRRRLVVMERAVAAVSGKEAA